MTIVAKNNEETCKRSGEIAAFLDGELAARDEAAFERHLPACAVCARRLNEQKRLLHALNSAFAPEKNFDLPADFVNKIVVRAESNVAGLRCGDERKRALIIVAALFLSGVAIGFVGKKSGFLPVVFDGFWRSLAVVGGFLFNFCYDFGLALVIALRAVARFFAADSLVFGGFLIVLLVVSLVALSRLLLGYARIETQK